MQTLIALTIWVGCLVILGTAAAISLANLLRGTC